MSGDSSTGSASSSAPPSGGHDVWEGRSTIPWACRYGCGVALDAPAAVHNLEEAMVEE